MIVCFYQLDAKILYFNTFTILLYMFGALLCSSSRGQIVLVQHLVSSLSLGDCSVHRLRESCRDLCTEHSKHVEEYSKCVKIKNLCIKLVRKDYPFTTFTSIAMKEAKDFFPHLRPTDCEHALDFTRTSRIVF